MVLAAIPTRIQVAGRLERGRLGEHCANDFHFNRNPLQASLQLADDDRGYEARRYQVAVADPGMARRSHIRGGAPHTS
jgi:hypothetical protein